MDDTAIADALMTSLRALLSLPEDATGDEIRAAVVRLTREALNTHDLAIHELAARAMTMRDALDSVTPRRKATPEPELPRFELNPEPDAASDTPVTDVAEPAKPVGKLDWALGDPRGPYGPSGNGAKRIF
jgi:hypothetical protein